jgi:CTP:molybdopterin cytidylyltransferase MocA
MGNRGAIDVIVLAGDRGPGDPLAVQAGVGGKTLVPVDGRAMLTRVVDTLAQWPRLARLILVAPNDSAYRRAVSDTGLAQDRLVWIEPAGSLSQSVRLALGAAGERRPVVMATADHPLLQLAWIERLLQAEAKADLLIALADWAAVMARFPGSRRTRYRFSDASICGTNLFLFQTGHADAVLDTWQRVEQERKRPWRIVSLLGWANLARFLSGRLALATAFEALSDSLGLEVRPVLLDDPLAAVDVDTPADLALVEQVLSERRPAC